MHHYNGLFVMVSLGYIIKFPVYSCCLSTVLPSELGNINILNGVLIAHYGVSEKIIPPKDEKLYKKCRT